MNFGEEKKKHVIQLQYSQAHDWLEGLNLSAQIAFKKRVRDHPLSGKLHRTTATRKLSALETMRCQCDEQRVTQRVSYSRDVTRLASKSSSRQTAGTMALMYGKEKDQDVAGIQNDFDATCC